MSNIPKGNKSSYAGVVLLMGIGAGAIALALHRKKKVGVAPIAPPAPKSDAYSLQSGSYQGPEVVVDPGCASSTEPVSYNPYGQTVGAAFDQRYPNAEDSSSKYPSGCAATGEAAPGYQMSLDSLMPASWQPGATVDSSAAADNQWTKYAPSKDAYARYITAAGSARLSMNTRTSLARQTGIPLLLRQSPPVPVSATEYAWGDSGFRQDLVFRQTGMYPKSTSC